MADGSGIEWTEATWNPTTGCDRISAGCDNCDALMLAKRLKAMGNPKYQADGFASLCYYATSNDLGVYPSNSQMARCEATVAAGGAPP